MKKTMTLGIIAILASVASHPAFACNEEGAREQVLKSIQEVSVAQGFTFEAVKALTSSGTLGEPANWEKTVAFTFDAAYPNESIQDVTMVGYAMLDSNCKPLQFVAFPAEIINSVAQNRHRR